MDCLTVKSESRFHIVQIELLLAIEVSDYLCTFYVENEPPFSCVESLGKMLSKLPDGFIRISRNCIINARHVKFIDFKRHEVKLTGNKVFNFSVRNAQVLRQVFDQ